MNVKRFFWKIFEHFQTKTQVFAKRKNDRVTDGLQNGDYKFRFIEKIFSEIWRKIFFIENHYKKVVVLEKM